MPTYEYDCAGCGRIEVFRKMTDFPLKRCPKCRKAVTRIYSCFFHGAVDANQESENGGLGRWYPQMGAQFLDAKTKKIRNPASHAKSQREAIDKFKRKGYTVEKA